MPYWGLRHSPGAFVGALSPIFFCCHPPALARRPFGVRVMRWPTSLASLSSAIVPRSPTHPPDPGGGPELLEDYKVTSQEPCPDMQPLQFAESPAARWEMAARRCDFGRPRMVGGSFALILVPFSPLILGSPRPQVPPAVRIFAARAGKLPTALILGS